MKKILCSLLIVMMVVCFMPTMAWAETGAGMEPEPTAITATSGELAGGSYILNEDITLTTNLTILENATVSIDLNGHILTGTGTGPVITVAQGGSLTITDSNSNNPHNGVQYIDSEGLWKIGESEPEGATALTGTDVLTGGIITGGTSQDVNNIGSLGGGCILVNKGATVTMTGGTIAGNTGSNGGAICLDASKAAAKSTFTMNGGSIAYNVAKFGGGAVFVHTDSEFNLTNGSIEKNTAVDGGGLYIDSAGLKMSGGLIDGNVANNTDENGNYSGQGGGVAVLGNSQFEMSGGTISNNTANSHGGGIHLLGNFTMTGGTISNNTAVAQGGGLCTYSDSTNANISGGTISGNAARAGGGIFVYAGNVSVSGTAAVTGNTAKYIDGTISYGKENPHQGGAGIYVRNSETTNTLTLNGAAITGNTAINNSTNSYAPKGGGVYAAGVGQTVEVSGKTVVSGNLLKDSAEDSGSANNMYLRSFGGKLEITGELTSGANLSFNSPSTAAYTIAQGTDTYTVTDDDAACFQMDDTSTKLVVVKHSTENKLILTSGLNVTLYSDSNQTNSEIRTVLSGTDVGDIANPFQRDGWNFIGWDTDSADDVSTVTDGMELYAQWEGNTYNITYELNNGTADNNAPATHKNGTTTTLVDPTRSGYSFGGWYDNADCTGTAITTLGATDVTADITLYAKWTKNSSGGGYYVSPVTTAKNTATTALTTAATAETYDTEEQAQVDAIVTQAKADISKATTKAEVQKIQADALAAIDAIPTAAEKQAAAEEQAKAEAEAAAKTERIKNGVENTTLKAKSKVITRANGKLAIRIDWTKSKGYKVDYYEVHRSVKKNSGYGKKPFFTTSDGDKCYYINTKNVKKGNTYYFYVRGVRIIDGEKVYTEKSTKAWRTIK